MVDDEDDVVDPAIVNTSKYQPIQGQVCIFSNRSPKSHSVFMFVTKKALNNAVISQSLILLIDQNWDVTDWNFFGDKHQNLMRLRLAICLHTNHGQMP